MSASLDFDHPWPGPDWFRREDAPFFRGRETEILQLLRLIRHARSVVLYGASGLGKTSLINAGVVPRLEQGEYFPVPIRISYVAGAHPVSEQIQAELIKSRGTTGGLPRPLPGRTAWEFLHLRHEPIEGAQPLLIFDQFEELFTIGSGTPQAAQLVEELKALIEAVPPPSVAERLERDPSHARSLSFQRNDHRVLLSIREDFLFGLESLRTQIPSLIHNRYWIRPLSGSKAMEVVTQPPRQSAGEPPAKPEAVRPPLVDSDVAEVIVRTVASAVADRGPLDALEVDPALLSILCTELARRRAPGTSITTELVTGNRTEIISTFYERALHDAPLTVRVFIEDELVTEKTRFRTSAVVVEALTVPGFTSAVLAGLVNKRLLRLLDRPNGQWVELTHDVLTEVAARSRDLRREQQRALRERAARAQREKRRRNGVLAALGLLLVVLILFGSCSERRARDQAALVRQQSESAVLQKKMLDDTTEAKRALRWQYIDASLREKNYREALAQLALVVREEPEAAWARALTSDLLLRRNWPLPTKPLFPAGPFTRLDCSRSATRCAAAYRDGRVLVRGDLYRDLNTGQKGYEALKMSADGERLVIVPETPGAAIQWTFGPSSTGESRFDIKATWGEWDASDDVEVIALPEAGGLTVWQPRTHASHFTPLDIGNAPLSVSPDGNWIAYQKDLRSIAIVDAQGKETPRTFEVPDLTYLNFDSASKVLLAAAGDGVFRRWRLPDCGRLNSIKAHRRVTRFMFDTTGKQMAAVLEGGGLELWREPWLKAQTLMESSGGVMTVSFAPEGDWLAVAGRDGVVRLWSSSGASLAEPIRHDGLAFAHALSDHVLLSVSMTGSSARWNIRPVRVPQTYDLKQPIRSAWFLSEDKLYASGASVGLEQSIGGEGRTERLYPGRTFFSRDRRYTASWYTNILYLRPGLPPGPGLDRSDTELARGKIDDVQFSADGERLVAIVSAEARLYDVKTGAKIGDPIEDVADAWLSSDGKTLATKASDTGVTLWHSAGDGALERVADIDALVVSRVAFDRANERVVLVSENQARVWSLRDRRFTGRPLSHDGPIMDAAFSPDGRWIVTTSEDTRARIWEAVSGLPASDWFEHGGSVVAADFSPSGRLLLTASTDGQVRIWKVPGGVDATEQERLRLARLAEVVSGMRTDSTARDAPAASHADEALEALRHETDDCPLAPGDPKGCASDVGILIQDVLGRDPPLRGPP